ncbi:MAG: hypothetical protein F6J86_19390 [Symploca sp. SIO1B1]|nr:hypothetical protein [Symploca sp. SIO1B1]
MIYLPPARIGDFTRSPNANQLSQAWHDRVKEQIDRYRTFDRFLDPLDADETAAREVIPWTGFPRIFDVWLSIDESSDSIERNRRMDRAHRSAEILNRFTYIKLRNDGRFHQIPADPANGLLLYPQTASGDPALQDGFFLAERPQDEYLEWFLVRDPDTRRITRIDFTVEAPEYWETLAEGDPDLVQTIYSELLGKTVPKEDLFFSSDIVCPELEQTARGDFQFVGFTKLFPDEEDFKAGQYNRWNKWNTEQGIVHLTQRNNTLFAEINLAATATQRFAIRPDLSANVDRFALTACGGYGAVNRNSDPTIGQSVNSLALSNFRVMVSNPIGLYIGEINLSGFRDPEGNLVPSEQILTIHRGSFNDEDGLARVLRFSVHPPAGATYGLENCTFDGFPLTTGGPIARQTTVVIHGIAMADNGSHSLTRCLAKSCPHPTKKPQYYIAIRPGDNCPDSNDPSWNDAEAPVTLAPELSRLLPLEGAPRSMGNRG